MSAVDNLRGKALNVMNDGCELLAVRCDCNIDAG